MVGSNSSATRAGSISAETLYAGPLASKMRQPHAKLDAKALQKFAEIVKDSAKLATLLRPHQVTTHMRLLVYQELERVLIDLFEHCELQLVGSIAKDTDLDQGDSDIDALLILKNSDSISDDLQFEEALQSMEKQIQSKLNIDVERRSFYGSVGQPWVSQGQKLYARNRNSYLHGTYHNLSFDLLIGAPLEDWNDYYSHMFFEPGLAQRGLGATLTIKHVAFICNSAVNTDGIRLVKWWMLYIAGPCLAGKRVRGFFVEVLAVHTSWFNATPLETLMGVLRSLIKWESLEVTHGWPALHWQQFHNASQHPIVLDPCNIANNLAGSVRQPTWSLLAACAEETLHFLNEIPKGMCSKCDIPPSDKSLYWNLACSQYHLMEAHHRHVLLEAELEQKTRYLIESHEEIASLKTKLEQAERLQSCKRFSWQFEENDGTWTSLSAENSEQVMMAFKKSQEHMLTVSGVAYLLDFQMMTQTRIDTQKQRRIRCHFDTPSSWTRDSSHFLMQISRALQPLCFASCTSEIYDPEKLQQFTALLRHSVRHHCTRFQGGDGCDHLALTFRVHRAFRVENMQAYHAYLDRCRDVRIGLTSDSPTIDDNSLMVGEQLSQLAEELGIVSSPLNEKVLLHGTSVEAAHAVAVEGFDNRLAREGAYGRGTYFASQSCKCAQYGKRSKAIIVSRVALGNPHFATQIDKTMARPPKKLGGGFHDSVIALPGFMPGHRQLRQTHIECVVFDRAQAYPEIILHYSA